MKVNLSYDILQLLQMQQGFLALIGGFFDNMPEIPLEENEIQNVCLSIHLMKDIAQVLHKTIEDQEVELTKTTNSKHENKEKKAA